MERTISFMNGKGSIGHNTRSFIADNVDASRTKIILHLSTRILSKSTINCLTRRLRNTMQNRNARTGRLKAIMKRYPGVSRKNYFMR